MSMTIRIMLALAAALLFALGEPPRLYWAATFAGLVLLLCALRDLSPRFAFWIATATGTLICGLSVPWFRTIFSGATPFALFVVFGLFYGLFAAGSAFIAPRFVSPWPRAFWISSSWVAVEFYRCEWFALRFPWVTPGVALGPTWLTPLVGVYGQSFIAVLTAAYFCERKTRNAGIVLAVALMLLVSLRPPPVAPLKPLRVALVQFEDEDFDTQFALTRAATNSPQLVVWPEGAIFGGLWYDHKGPFSKLSANAKASNVVFTIGCRTEFGNGERDWFNTALTFDGTGVLGEHHKNRPVHLFNDGKPGTNAVAIATPLGKIGTPICFDCDFTEITRRMARDGAEFFAVPARDAAQWGPLQRVQHAQFFRLRAAECGRWFAVAMSSGITQIIDPHGNTRAALPPFQPGVLCGEIGREHSQTFYIAYGWLLPWLLTAIAIIGGIVAVIFPILGNSRRANFQ